MICLDKWWQYSIEDVKVQTSSDTLLSTQTNIQTNRNSVETAIQTAPKSPGAIRPNTNGDIDTNSSIKLHILPNHTPHKFDNQTKVKN